MENKTGKYLKYAIGEIVLVVIGILIALQINNWNEWRKDRVKEKVILNDLAKNVEINILNLKTAIDLFQQWNRSSEIVLTALENKLEFTDSLKWPFHEARITKIEFIFSNIGYQAYKDQGLDIITNKALSSEIINLYEVTLPGALETKRVINNMNDDFDNHVVQNFTYDAKGLTPNNYESLYTDHFYISWVKAYKQGRIDLMNYDRTMIEECERVLQLIKEELNKQNALPKNEKP